MPPHPLTNFEIQKYYQNEPKLNGVLSRHNLLKAKDGPYVINLSEYESIGTHWRALYVNGNNGRGSYDATYFESFGAEHIPKDIKKYIRNKNIITNIYRIQAYNLIICGYLCIGFIDFMLRDRSLLDNTNVFCHSKYEKNDKITLIYF